MAGMLLDLLITCTLWELRVPWNDLFPSNGWMACCGRAAG